MVMGSHRSNKTRKSTKKRAKHSKKDGPLRKMDKILKDSDPISYALYHKSLIYLDDKINDINKNFDKMLNNKNKRKKKKATRGN